MTRYQVAVRTEFTRSGAVQHTITGEYSRLDLAKTFMLWTAVPLQYGNIQNVSHAPDGLSMVTQSGDQSSRFAWRKYWTIRPVLELEPIIQTLIREWDHGL